MSIIYDALRKTQKNRNAIRVNDFHVQRMPWMDVGLILVIACLLMYIAYGYAKRYYHHHQTKLAHEVAKPSVPVVAPAIAVAAPVKPAPRMSAQFTEDAIFKTKHVLHGVYLANDEKVALIDDGSFHVGDTVDDLKIVGIDFNSVKLQGDNRKVLLKVAL